MKKNCLICLVFTPFWLFPLHLAASPFYTESGVAQTTVTIADQDYRPIIVRAKLGYQISQIYALEAQIGTHVYDDTIDNKKMKIQNLTGIFLRYGTPVKQKLRAYGIAGLAFINTRMTTPNGTIVKEYSDFAYGIGFEERLISFPALSFTLEYTRYYTEGKDMNISGINAGIRAHF